MAVAMERNTAYTVPSDEPEKVDVLCALCKAVISRAIDKERYPYSTPLVIKHWKEAHPAK